VSTAFQEVLLLAEAVPLLLVVASISGVKDMPI
jgi:hypothetical protein